MAERFYNITKEEMESFLFAKEFKPLQLTGVSELVYGKIINPFNTRMSLRVYTGINWSGESREKGTDAIRIQLMFELDGKPTPVGRNQKCLRVKSWQKNIAAAIEKATDSDHFRLCIACGMPLVIRENSKTGEEFWGCIGYWKGCTGKPKNATQVKAEPIKSALKVPPWEADDDSTTKTVEEAVREAMIYVPDANLLDRLQGIADELANGKIVCCKGEKACSN